jgi:hypothetical protein
MLSPKLSRRELLFGCGALAFAQPATSVEKWGVFRANVPAAGPVAFRHERRTVTVDAFEGRGGRFEVRFMPDAEGNWSYPGGSFVCTKPKAGNHGPVLVKNTTGFEYADGTPHYSFGTTCYAWNHQGNALEEQTLATLAKAPFNKIRMCVFPKWYEYNRAEPALHPLVNGVVNNAYFEHLEQRVADLMALGIEADLILFHPYDKWGYSKLTPEQDERYLRHVIARLGAYRNVWWSVANEWDLVKTKTRADWERYFRIIQEADPYRRLLSIHHSVVMWDHSRPYITHASIQGDEFERIPEWREQWKKPIVFDECKYEGNIPKRWGDISAQEMVHRFWLGTCMGAWVGHGETYLDKNDILWWSKGGVLHGGSAPRIAFLRKAIEAAGPMEPVAKAYYPTLRASDSALIYFSVHQPAEFPFDVGPGSYRAELLDPWEMTSRPLEGTYSGKAQFRLPGRPHLALRLTRA